MLTFDHSNLLKNMLFLVTRPRYDPATHYLYHWMGIVLLKAKQRGISFIDIEKEDVEKIRVQSYIRKRSPDVVILNGHGNNDSVVGDDNKEIVFLASSILSS